MTSAEAVLRFYRKAQAIFARFLREAAVSTEDLLAPLKDPRVFAVTFAAITDEPGEIVPERCDLEAALGLDDERDSRHE